MKIVDCGERRGRTVNAEDIPEGQVFRGKILSYASGVFLQTFIGIVALDANITWSDALCKVENYDPVEAELHILS